MQKLVSEVLRHAEPKSGLSFGLMLFLHCAFIILMSISTDSEHLLLLVLSKPQLQEPIALETSRFDRTLQCFDQIYSLRQVKLKHYICVI